MTIREVQDFIGAWEARHGVEEECSCRTAGRSAVAEDVECSSESLASAMWDLFSQANRQGIDLTEAIIDCLEEKNAAALRP